MPEQTAAKKRTFRSLTVTLAIAFLAMSLTVLIITSSLQVYSNFQDQQRVISDQQKLIAQGAADAVKNFINVKFDTLEATASLGNLADSRQDQQEATLGKLLHLEPAFRQIVLFNAQGQELARNSRWSYFGSNKPQEQFNDEIFSQVSQGKRYISPIFIDEISSEPMVIMAVPVNDVFGDVKGMLAAQVNLKFMWDLVGSLKIGNSGTAYVVDRQGDLIASRDISRVLRGENLIQLKEVSEFVNNKEIPPVYDAKVSKGIQGNDVVANYVPLGTPDWAVVVELPVNEAYQSLIQGFIRSVLIILLSLVLAIVAGIYLSKIITKPIILLRNATREISKGKLDTRIEIKSEDEIGELTDSFNKMTEDLQKTTVSKNYVDNILRSMFDMLVVLAPDNTIQTVNQTTCDVLGFRTEELVGQPFNVLLADENLQLKGAWIDELIKKGSINNIERIYTTKNGRKIPVIFSASIMRDNDGNMQGIVCVAHDITERKEAEKAIVEKEEEYRTILSTTMDGFWITDINGRFLDVNNAYCRLIGYSRVELLAMGIQDIEKKERPEETRQRITRIRELGFDRFETRHRCKDGRIVDVEVSVNYLGVDEGRLFVFLRDITERKQAEEALRGLNADHEAIIDNAPAMIWYKDTKDNFIRVNPAAAKAFGKSIGEIEGKNACELFPNMAEKYYQDDLKVIKSGKPNLGIIEQMPTSSGEIIWVQTDKIPLKDERGTIRGVLVFVVDITERKKAEELLKHFNEELEEKVKSRTEELNASLEEKVVLLREVHHRVKNNLQILISLLNLQSRTISDPQVIKAMKESSQRIRAMSMVHEKLYTGRDLAHIDFINYLSSLANSQIAFYQLGIDKKVTFEITGKNIMLDINIAIPLGLVMNELLSNALKHAFPGDRRGIIRIDVRKSKDRLEISIADDGVGIPEGFDWAASQSLGLRLINMLVEQLSGTITLDQTEGTAYHISIPKKEQ